MIISSKMPVSAITLVNFSMFSQRIAQGLLVIGGLLMLAAPGVTLAAVNAPHNLEIVGGKYTNDKTPTFTWSAPVGATWYEVKIDSQNYTGLSNVLSYTSPTLTDGWHSFAVRARNSASSISTESTIVFEIDTRGPEVSRIDRSSAVENQLVTLGVTSSGEAWTSGCNLLVDGADKGAMNRGGGNEFLLDYTFKQDRDYEVRATCTDGDGNTTVGPVRELRVSASNTIPNPPVAPPTSPAKVGDLVKLRCGSNPGINDNCRAVYYWGEDGKRHAFPNEAVFYSWYGNFNGVKEISSSTMSNLRIGRNVTIKPGTHVVKFATSDAIYAVAEGGILRHFLTPALLRADYGTNWSRFLVVISDVFFGNYSIGADIDSSNDYDRYEATNGVTSIDDNF